MKLVITCEHAFPDIPEKYQHLFEKDPEVLNTHEAFDPGAFELFRALEQFADFSKYQTIGRLLVETNRSYNHQKLYSRYSSKLSGNEKDTILQKFYWPYRREIKENIEQFIKEGHTVLHLSIHSFTPVWNSIERNCDIGLLYDPRRIVEKKFCNNWKKSLLQKNSKLNIRFNYPYLGKSDGFTTALRSSFLDDYLGIELEVNQKWVIKNSINSGLKNNIIQSIQYLKNKKPQN